MIAVLKPIRQEESISYNMFYVLIWHVYFLKQNFVQNQAEVLQAKLSGKTPGSNECLLLAPIASLEYLLAKMDCRTIEKVGNISLLVWRRSV